MNKKLVFLFDVDNTLLDNDRVTADLKQHLEREIGHERQERYWSIFEELRTELAKHGGPSVSIAAMGRTLTRMGLPRKKSRSTLRSETRRA